MNNTLKTYLGIDNGVTGAMAALYADESWEFQPVAVENCGKDRVLDVRRNLDFLRRVALRSGGAGQVVVAYEKQKKNPLFGTKGNFSNGRHEEFWRVLLTLNELPFCVVDPNTWQNDVLNGIPGTDTKARARVYVGRRFPTVNLAAAFNAARQEAIRDAMCIAAWARSNSR